MTDDDPDDYYLFASVLKEVNDAVKLTWFNTCDGLLDFLKAGDDLPDIIVLDMNMPGNNGNACLLSIKSEARLHHIPVIIYSTSGTPPVVKKAMECGAFNYYVKPTSIILLRELIKELLSIQASDVRNDPK
jgi:DNA-binding NtrC family response regulator